MGTKDDEVLQEFLQESRDNLAPFEAGLPRLEGEPASPQLLMDLYRYIHNVKGACGFLRFGGMETLARAGEELLELARQQRLALGPGHREALGALAEALRQRLARIEATGAEAGAEDAELLSRLRRLQEGASPASPPPARPPAPQGRS
jgi:chemotaxis protein histidine kinase CheA